MVWRPWLSRGRLPGRRKTHNDAVCAATTYHAGCIIVSFFIMCHMMMRYISTERMRAYALCGFVCPVRPACGRRKPRHARVRERPLVEDHRARSGRRLLGLTPWSSGVPLLAQRGTGRGVARAQARDGHPKRPCTYFQGVYV